MDAPPRNEASFPLITGAGGRRLETCLASAFAGPVLAPARAACSRLQPPGPTCSRVRPGACDLGARSPPGPDAGGGGAGGPQGVCVLPSLR